MAHYGLLDRSILLNGEYCWVVASPATPVGGRRPLGGDADRAVVVVITDGIVVGWLGLRLGAG